MLFYYEWLLWADFVVTLLLLAGEQRTFIVLEFYFLWNCIFVSNKRKLKCLQRKFTRSSRKVMFSNVCQWFCDYYVGFFQWYDTFPVPVQWNAYCCDQYDVQFDAPFDAPFGCNFKFSPKHTTTEYATTENALTKHAIAKHEQSAKLPTTFCTNFSTLHSTTIRSIVKLCPGAPIFSLNILYFIKKTFFKKKKILGKYVNQLKNQFSVQYIVHMHFISLRLEENNWNHSFNCSWSELKCIEYSIHLFTIQNSTLRILYCNHMDSHYQYLYKNIFSALIFDSYVYNSQPA